MKNQNIITFGCRLNSFDSQIIKEKAKLANLHNTFFINTCAVTKEAEKQAKTEAEAKTAADEADAQNALIQEKKAEMSVRLLQ